MNWWSHLYVLIHLLCCYMFTTDLTNFSHDNFWSIPELELQLNSNSNWDIGIEIEALLALLWWCHKRYMDRVSCSPWVDKGIKGDDKKYQVTANFFVVVPLYPLPIFKTTFFSKSPRKFSTSYYMPDESWSYYGMARFVRPSIRPWYW